MTAIEQEGAPQPDAPPVHSTRVWFLHEDSSRCEHPGGLGDCPGPRVRMGSCDCPDGASRKLGSNTAYARWQYAHPTGIIARQVRVAAMWAGRDADSTTPQVWAALKTHLLGLATEQAVAEDRFDACESDFNQSNLAHSVGALDAFVKAVAILKGFPPERYEAVKWALRGQEVSAGSFLEFLLTQ